MINFFWIDLNFSVLELYRLKINMNSADYQIIKWKMGYSHASLDNFLVSHIRNTFSIYIIEYSQSNNQTDPNEDKNLLEYAYI